MRCAGSRPPTTGSPGWRSSAGWRSSTWLLNRLLAGDRDTLALLRTNPFPGAPPVFVRARLFRYRFTAWRELRETGAWWQRSPIREFIPPVTGRPRDRVT